MQSVLISLVLLGGLGALFGLLLAFAAKKFAVEADPRIDEIEKILPGANCGACGYPGCRGAAEAIVEGKAPITVCPVGKAAVAEKIGVVMGKAVEAVRPQKAVVLCRGGRTDCPDRFVYRGVPDCRAANRLAGGPKACEYGCLGLGSCVAACPFGAIRMNEEGLPVIGTECTGCGRCVRACPRGIIALIPADRKVEVNACRNRQRGAEVRKICRVGCLGCGLCARTCPEKAITIVENLAVIDPEKCTGCGLCFAKCPVRKDREKEKPAPEERQGEKQAAVEHALLR
ncbi:MAG: RnfABCDGE type electron transport complex subunit B [Firmicutes bacterium]|nr:RnfABCDGE type electron transport complex subunit B [Bacillota bacterium]